MESPVLKIIGLYLKTLGNMGIPRRSAGGSLGVIPRWAWPEMTSRSRWSQRAGRKEGVSLKKMLNTWERAGGDSSVS